MLPEFIPMYDNLTKKKKLPIWFHTSYTFSNFSKLPERLDRQCIHHNPLKPNNKYIIHNLPYTSLITVRQELYPAWNHIFFYPIRCTHVLRSNTRVAGDHIRRFPSSIKGITTKRSSARKTISIPSPPMQFVLATWPINLARDARDPRPQSDTKLNDSRQPYVYRVPRDNRRLLESSKHCRRETTQPTLSSKLCRF